MYNLIQNSSSQPKKDEEDDIIEDEILGLVLHMKNTNSLLKNIVLTPGEYFVTCFDGQQIEDMNKFCSSSTNPLVIDTTFDLCDMWLTDTAYQNLRLINGKNQHPWFYGPCLFHMKKGSETFSRFALDMVVSSPGLKNPSFLGTDMEKAMFDGFKRVFPDLKNLLCVKHLSDRDKRKLTSMGGRGIKTIISDIYGSNDGITKEIGLSSAEDSEDFMAKLESLKPIWDDLSPGFHDWFTRVRATKFTECVIQSAREGSKIEGLFYNNAIESLHSVLKSGNSGKQPIIKVVEMVENLIKNQRMEEVRAICQSGEYRLSEEFQAFSVSYIFCSHLALILS